MTAKLMAQAQAALGVKAVASPLLRYLAGSAADAIAAVWRAPHAEFFALPAARRHAAAIVLLGLAPGDVDRFALRRVVEYARDAEVARLIMGADAPGLMKALAKAGEVLWSARDYASFMDLFAEPMGNAVLRHMDEVRPAAITAVHELPPPLRVVSIVRIVPDRAAAYDLGLAFRLATQMSGDGCTASLARSWGAGGDRSQVFRRAQEDLTPERFRPRDPPPQLGAGFERVVHRKQLERAARDFRNCLAEHAQRIAEGRMAVYLWAPPVDVGVAAAIALSSDVAGWRLSEAKAADNVDLGQPQLEMLVAAVGRHGVRTGPSVPNLIGRLADHAYGTDYTQRPPDDFVGRLALGDLWS